MPVPVSKLEVVLWNLLEEYREGDADELSAAEAERVGRIIRDTLEIDDAPSSREPGEIVDFAIHNCWSGSRAAAERWLNSLTQDEVADLQLGDVLAALSPGLEGDIDELADEDDAGRVSMRVGRQDSARRGSCRWRASTVGREGARRTER
jgi:hypothetical protein